MKEYTKIRQEKTGFRRLFYDELFDLYIWYNEKDAKKIIGFQVVYNAAEMQKALTWTEKDGYTHTGIDEGDRTFMNQSPILIQDGLFEYDFVYGELLLRMKDLEKEIRDLVISKIEEYRLP